MSRKITVSGTGKVSVKPDFVILSANIESQDIEYEKAMEQSAAQLDELRGLLADAGFDPGDVRTADFRVRTDYAQEQVGGVYRSVFRGYVCSHSLTLSFPLDRDMLARAIAAVSGSSAKPTLSVSFTVKDPDAVSAEVLRLAAASARRSAETLCAAAGVALGELVSIEYGDGELNPISRTGCGARDISAVAMMKCAESVPDITPDDISVSDTAVFVWEIRG